MNRNLTLISALVLSLTSLSLAGSVDWPATDRTCRPWAYNWWMGSAVDKENLSRELKRYREAGLGGIHIIPIYGVKGAENRYIPYLSPKWMELLSYTVQEAEKLDLGVDMTTGSGWCFGGPCITPELGCRKYVLKREKGQYILKDQFTGLKVKRAAPGAEGPMLNPFYDVAMRKYLEWFTPVFDAPGIAKPRAMYHDSYEYFGANWSPNLLEEFAKRRGYKLQDELSAFAEKGQADRARRVRCDWRETLSDMLIEQVFSQWTAWCRQRGMLTRNEAHGAPVNLLDFYALADIPETEMFNRGAGDPLVSIFDAHIGEGNRNPLICKFASSAAHAAGKQRVSSETGTWLAEHFCETFEELKSEIDLLFLSGINHVFYHGCAYSPDDAPWPGWLFYASTQMNPRNPLWCETPALNKYVERCQSVLRSGQPDNEVLLYWPIHELWSQGKDFQLTIHSTWLADSSTGQAARLLWDKGYGFDYVSDRLLSPMQVIDGNISFKDGTHWRAVAVPECRQIPVNTLEKLLNMAHQGATLIFENHLPDDVPGLSKLDSRRKTLQLLLGKLPLHPVAGNLYEAEFGQGRILVGPLDAALHAGGIERETLVDYPRLKFIRRRHELGWHYLLVNHNLQPLEGWVSLATPARAVLAMDAMTGVIGTLPIRKSTRGTTEVNLRIEPGHSIILRTFAKPQSNLLPLPPSRPGATIAEIKSPWEITFIAGGPSLARSIHTAELKSWTLYGDSALEAFSGTALYRTTFHVESAIADKPCILDLGQIRHVAHVMLNGRDMGTLIMHPYHLAIPTGILKSGSNTLEVAITNLGANRIRDLDRRKVPWRIFHEINFVNISYKPFDASGWPIFESGLLGPVCLRLAE